MPWFYLLLAGCGEVAGVLSMKRWTENKSLVAILTVALSFAFSFSFLSLAMNTIPMGTAYAIWTGIGTTGSALLGVFLFKESLTPIKILFIGLILFGAIGLKLLGSV